MSDDGLEFGMSVGSEGLGWLDGSIILLYVLVLIVLSLRARNSMRRMDVETESTSRQKEENYLLSGRKLTLPAFVATLVSTWYGGILGVGEFSYLYGISQWVVMGLPYYLFAVLFAFFLAGKIRASKALSIPEAVYGVYGNKASKLSAGLIFLLVNPAPYILMVALIAQYVLGFEGWYFPVIVALFSAFYVSWGGFGAVVRTDVFQAVLMYVGFGVLLYAAWSAFGSPIDVWNLLPDYHKDPTGGQEISYLLVWFFIALWTFVDPGFHQRAAAAKSGKTARNGILVSVGFWFIFDMATLITALYGVVMFTELPSAALIYPAMADHLLPFGLKGLFFLTLLATIMSTLDSFLFISGQTLGRDMISGTHTIAESAPRQPGSDSNPSEHQAFGRNSHDLPYAKRDSHFESSTFDTSDSWLNSEFSNSGSFKTTNAENTPDHLGSDSNPHSFGENSDLHLWGITISPVQRTQIGILFSAFIGVVLVWLFPSVIDLWYVIGSVLIPGLLLPILGIYYPAFRVPVRVAPYLIGIPVLVSLGWLMGGLYSDSGGYYTLWGIEPFYPGLTTSVVIFSLVQLRKATRL